MSDYVQGVLTAAVALVPVLGTAIVAILVAIRKSRSQALAEDATTDAARQASAATLEARRDKSALGPLREALAEARKDIELLKANNRTQQETIDELRGESSDCETRLAVLYVHLEHLHAYACRSYDWLIRLGQDVPGPPPDLPERPGGGGSEDFRHREQQQRSRLLDSAIMPPPPPPTDGPK